MVCLICLKGVDIDLLTFVYCLEDFDGIFDGLNLAPLANLQTLTIVTPIWTDTEDHRDHYPFAMVADLLRPLVDLRPEHPLEKLALIFETDNQGALDNASPDLWTCLDIVIDALIAGGVVSKVEISTHDVNDEPLAKQWIDVAGRGLPKSLRMKNVAIKLLLQGLVYTSASI